jgi:hypothetical protein
MKTNVSRLCWIAPLLGLAAPVAFAAVAKSDILPGAKRRDAIATATRLARPGEMPQVAGDIASPFSPPDFTQPVEEAVATTKSGSAASTSGAGATAAAAAGGPAKPSSARDIVDSLTPLIPAVGIIQRGTENILNLSVGGRYFVVRVGETINIGATAEAQKYPLEVTSIKSSEFTVRYQGESKTRPIVVKPSTSSK